MRVLFFLHKKEGINKGRWNSCHRSTPQQPPQPPQPPHTIGAAHSQAATQVATQVENLSEGKLWPFRGWQIMLKNLLEVAHPIAPQSLPAMTLLFGCYLVGL